MESNPLKKGILTLNSVGIGEVSQEMLLERALELALINGRTVDEISEIDWEQARRELTDESEIDPKQEFLESAPESERWDPIFGSTGHQVEVHPAPDDEGQSDDEILYEEGVREAEHDQMLEAARTQNQDDER